MIKTLEPLDDDPYAEGCGYSATVRWNALSAAPKAGTRSPTMSSLDAIADYETHEDGCCALEPDHDGPCAWVCSDCEGSTHCWACGGPSGDDLGTGCTECDGTGACFHCYEGMVSDA